MFESPSRPDVPGLRSRTRAWALLLATALVHVTGCGSAPTTVGSEALPWSDAGRAVVLAVRADVFDSSARSGTAVTDLEWINLLTERFGSCDVVPALEIEANPRGRLDGRRLLVLPRATAAALEPQLLRELEALVEEGLTVIVEHPDTTHAAWLGLRVAAQERVPLLAWPYPVPSLASSTGVPGAGVVPPAFAVSHAVARFAPGADPRRRAQVVQAVANRPAVWVLERGKGSWVSLAQQLAGWAGAWREDPRGGLSPERVHFPWTRAWTAFVFGGDATPTPMPGWAVHPPGHAGWLALSETRNGASGTGSGQLRVGGTVLVRPLAASGLTSASWVLPSCLSLDGSPESTAALVALLRTNRAHAQGVLQVCVPPGDAARRDEAITLARSQHHQLTDPAGLTAWWQARERSVLHWSFEGADLQIEVSVDPAAAGGLELALPRSWRHLHLVDWTASWSPASATTVDRFGASQLHVEVPAGTRGTARALYR